MMWFNVSVWAGVTQPTRVRWLPRTPPYARFPCPSRDPVLCVSPCASDLWRNRHCAALRDVHGAAAGAAGVAGHPDDSSLGGQLPAQHTYGLRRVLRCVLGQCRDAGALRTDSRVRNLARVALRTVWQHSLHRHLVFGTGGPYWKSLVATYVSYSASIVISSGITYALEHVGVGEQVSYFVSTAATGVVNYFMLASAFEPEAPRKAAD